MCNYEQMSDIVDKELENRINFLVQHTGKTKSFYMEQLDQTELHQLEQRYLSPDLLNQLNDNHLVSCELEEISQVRGWE